MSTEIKIEYKPLSWFTAADHNPKKHADSVLDHSIERFGFVQPVTIDERTGKLVAGHGRIDALRRMHADNPTSPPARVQVFGGEWQVPVIRGVVFSNQDEADAYLLADNRIVEVGGWDDVALADMIEGLQSAGVSLDGIGWDSKQLDDIIQKASEQEEKPSGFIGGNADNSEAIGISASKPVTQRGDLW